MQDIATEILFMKEIDQLKRVNRVSFTTCGTRRENTAEHSWHVSVMPLVYGKYATEEVDMHRVTSMLLIHDIVEIDAGDTYAFDKAARDVAYEIELAAAKRIFGMLDDERGKHMLGLWLEFEAEETPEARFAKVLDLSIPTTVNYYSGGMAWQEKGISYQQVLDHLQERVEGYSPAMWQMIKPLLDDARSKGWLKG